MVIYSIFEVRFDPAGQKLSTPHADAFPGSPTPAETRQITMLSDPEDASDLK